MTRTLAAAGAAGSAALRWVLAALVVLTTVSVIVPFAPRMPGAGLDRSWTFAMNQATAQHLDIGRDVIFTFGPYASIYTGTYHPATDAMMLWGSLVFALCFGIAAVLAFKNGRWPLQLGLIAVLHAVMYVRDPFFFYYPVLVGVCAMRELRATGGDDTGHARRMALLLLLLLPFGLLPLVKGTAWVLCAVVTAIIVALFAMQRQWKLAALVAATPLLAAVLFWLLAGQPLTGLPGYFVSMMPIVSGYTEAMSIQGSTWQVLAYAVAAASLIAVMIVARDGAPLRTKAALIATCAAALFLGFKGGFVRHDEHAMVAATFLLLMGLLVAAMYPRSRASMALLLCFCVWWSIDAAYTKTSTAKLLSTVRADYKAAWDGARLRVTDRDRLAREFEQAVAKLRTEAGFPTLSGSSDIYSYDQSYLIASGNRWNPRPVIQSYSAYTPSLLEANKAHLLGRHAPDNLIFSVQPIDDRLPSLEDGASWPVILRQYRPTAFKNDYLFLQRRGEAPQAERAPLATAQHAIGETVRVPDSATPLFVKIDLKPTALGALAGLLYKPTPLRITLTFETGATRSYRIVSGMARAGFLISPLIENTPELALLYGGADFIRHKRVRSFSIAPAGGNSLWQSRFDVEFTPVSFPSSPEAVQLLNLDRPTPLAATQKIEPAAHCDGSIDILNGQTPPPASFEATRLLGLAGWLAISTDRGQVPEQLLVVATQAGGPTYVVAARKHPRPDVAAHFGQPHLEASGYVASADISGLRGQFTLGLGYEADGKINLCPQFAIPGRLGGP
jgi:hypothetical protein